MSLRTGVLIAVATILVAGSASAHHNMSALFDFNDRVTLAGTLTKIDWRNPHPFFYIDVAGTNGQPIRWKLGTATPNMLVRYPGGWTRDKVFAKLNDEITVKGWQAKDGTNHLYGDMLTFSDGSMMQLGSGLGVV